MRKFYDIHMHALDISHANLTAFTSRIFDKIGLNLDEWQKKGNFWYFIMLIFRDIGDRLRSFSRKSNGPGSEKREKLPEKIRKIRNLMAYMEHSIRYDFLILEYYLKNKEAVVTPQNELLIGNESFQKMVLCPLIMDFGYKSMKQGDYFYHIPPQKPIEDQIQDLFNAIRNYFYNDLDITEQDNRLKFDLHPVDFNPDKKLFEVYPFMGINTFNYSYEKIEAMLIKYFSDFSHDESPEERQSRLFQKVVAFGGDLNNAAACSSIFAGIKLYPPLGFNPWPAATPQGGRFSPEEIDREQKKVELLYGWCVEKNIPVITHCSTGGFVADPDHRNLTHPDGYWRYALDHYPDLKIDFAHFGSGDEDWREAIMKHILTRPNNRVYTDISCSALHDDYYRELEHVIRKSQYPEKLTDRILFGSDFMINLIWSDSYNRYLTDFIQTGSLVNAKIKMCHENAERFLFG